MKVRAQLYRRWPVSAEFLIAEFAWGDDALVAGAAIRSATDDKAEYVVKFNTGGERVIGES